MCDHWLANKAYFSDITVKTFLRVLPTRWRRKPAGTEITPLSPYVYSPIYFTLFIYQSTSRKEMHSFTRKNSLRRIKQGVFHSHRLFARTAPMRPFDELLWTPV